jgi:hypothetical protein
MSDSNGAYVYVINEKSHIERRPVTVGATIENGIVITGGLTGAEHVVATAGRFLRDGERVTVAPPPAPADTRS